MIRSAFICAVLAITCKVSGADIIQDGLQHIEKLSQMTQTQRDSVSRLLVNTQLLAQQHRDRHEDILNRTAQAHVDLALKKAQQLNCHPSVFQELSLISEQTVRGWQDCLNITAPIGEIISVGLNFTRELESDEKLICSGLRNITLCNESSVIPRFECVISALGQLTEVFMDNSKGLLFWFEQLDVALGDLGLKIADCLNIANFSLFSSIDSKFDHRCPTTAAELIGEISLEK